MKWHFILGISTLLTGIGFIVVGTDYGRIVNVTLGVLVGAILLLLGIARLKYAWKNRHNKD